MSQPSVAAEAAPTSVVPPFARWANLAPWLVLLAAVAAQLPLVLNPGYFSHDELQWAAYAEQGATVAWLDVATFQYRPLTFNLWLALSRAFFATPWLMHAVLVVWGSLNAALLCAVGRRLGLGVGPAALGALAFVLSPYATYTHGWVGTLGDLVWLTCALLTFFAALRFERTLVVALAAGALTGAGLLAKEAAFAIPALCAVAWWFDGRRRRWLAATLGAGVVATAYLALRIGVLLHAPHEGSHYTVSVANVPIRWLEYQLFPPLVRVFEIAVSFVGSPTWHLVGAGALWLALLAALWRADRRLAAIFVVGGGAALGPTLVLGTSFNHYAYGFAAVAALTVAAAWSARVHWVRAVIVVYAAASLWHGVEVMRQMRAIGEIQAVFSPALAAAVRVHDGAAPVRLRVDADAPEWIFRRLTHHIPSYAGVEIGDRVRLVAPTEQADYVVRAGGRLDRL